jgi:WD40 repeat protein
MRVWDAKTRQLVSEPHLDSNLFTCLAISPDGTYFVTAGSKSMRRWNLDTGEPIGQPMTAHTDTVGDIDITADSRFIVSGSMDHTMRFWDATTDRPVGDPVNSGTDSVADVLVSSDDRRVLTLNVGSDQSFSTWLWPGPAAWHDDLCAKLTRNMSRSQWSQWVASDIDYRPVCDGLDELPSDK